MKHLYVLIVLSLFSFNSLLAQSQELVSGQFENRPVVEIIRQLCEQNSIPLFISDESLVQRSITVELDQVSFAQALERVLEGTPAGFMVYRNYAVVVGPRSRLNQTYTGAYYTRFEQVVSQDVAENEIVIGSRDKVTPFGKVEISGVVVDDLSDEPIVGASLIVEDSSDMTVSNADGGFRLNVPSGKQRLLIQSVGYDKTVLDLRVFSSDQVRFALSKNVLSLEEVTIEAVAEDVNVSSAQIGVTRVDIKGINKIPVFMGEVDMDA